jgi:hypothetical protein
MKQTAKNNLLLKTLKSKVNKPIFKQVTQIVNEAGSMQEARAKVISFLQQYELSAFGLLPLYEEAQGQLIEFNEDRLAWETVAEGKLKYMLFLADQLQKAKGCLCMVAGGALSPRFYMGTIKKRVTDDQLKEILGLPKGVK